MAFVIKLLKSLNPNLQFSCDFLLTILRLPCFWSGNLSIDSSVLDHVSRSSQNFWPQSIVLQTVVLLHMNFMNKKSGMLNRTRRNLRKSESTFLLIVCQDVFVDLFCNIFIFHIFKHCVKLFLNYVQLGKFNNKNQCQCAMGPTSSKIHAQLKEVYLRGRLVPKDMQNLIA